MLDEHWHCYSVASSSDYGPVGTPAGLHRNYCQCYYLPVAQQMVRNLKDAIDQRPMMVRLAKPTQKARRNTEGSMAPSGHRPEVVGL